MRLHHASLVSIPIASLLACAASQGVSPIAKPLERPVAVESAAVPPPMASFARMVGGEWSGLSAFVTWTWGPGKHSIRAGALELFYWHPGRKQVRVLSLHPDIPGIGRGSGEGTIKFEGESAEGVLDLYQPPSRRKLATRWTFDGPDKYHDALLEDTGAGFQTLAEWDRFREPKRSETRPRAAETAPKLPEHLKVFEALLGGTWDAAGDSTTGDAFHAQSTFEFVPDYVYARVIAPRKDGVPAHLLDAYFYQHVGTGALRCLALSNRGGVYEGDLTVLEGSALQLDLKGYEGEQVVARIVRFDFEKNGTLHSRVWSADGSERMLLLDVHHAKLAPENG